jgi:hypothetical protein
MLEYLHLKNVGPAPEMKMELAPRLNLITGDNGLGKTLLLDIAWWVLTQTWARRPAMPPRRAWRTPEGAAKGTSTIDYGYQKASGGLFEDEASFNRAEQYWPLKPGRPAITGMVIYAQVDGGFSAWDPARNHWKGKDPEQPELPPAYRFKREEVWDGLPIDSPKKLCNGLILDWASWQREKGDAFNQLTRVLRALSPGDREQLRPGRLMRIGLDDSRDHPTLTLPYKQEVPLVLASAGMGRIVALAYLLVWTWQEHLRACEIRGMKAAKAIIFLIDEIEAHLHPQWQRRIVKALLQVMEALTGTRAVSVQMIVTTHSPLVLASAEPIFDWARDAWFDLDLTRTDEGERVQLEKRNFVRRGDVSNWLTSEAFDLKEPRSLQAEVAVGEALGLLRKTPRPPLGEFEKVDKKLRGVLGDIDPFWIRWSHHLDQMRGEA